MNKSYETQNVQHLPNIKMNQSMNFSTNKVNLYTNLNKAASHRDMKNLGKKLIPTNDIKNIEEYESMNEKQLLREHEKLVKVLKKFQQLIDINLARKQKQKEKKSGKLSSREQVMQGEIKNNNKIIENYQKQISILEANRNKRKLNDIIDEKLKVNQEIHTLKKQIYTLKNQDMLAGRGLLNDRTSIQKQLHQHEKDLKLQLTKKNQYTHKIQQLTAQLIHLEKQCEGLNINELNQYKINNNWTVKINAKKSQLEEIIKSRSHLEDSIQESLAAKAKRNKNVKKQVQGCEKKITQINIKIMQYKQKISRYQKAMDLHQKQDK